MQSVEEDKRKMIDFVGRVSEKKISKKKDDCENGNVPEKKKAKRMSDSIVKKFESLNVWREKS